MATFETVTDVLDMLLRAKPASKLESFEKTVETWAMLLRNVPDGVLTQAAVMLALEPGPFIPDVGTVHNTALDLMDGEPPAEDAWALVVRFGGKASHPDAEPPPGRAGEALRLVTGGNLRACGEWTETDLPFRKREFLEAYAGLRARWKREASLALPAGEGRRLLDA